jgi:DNA invertase Pin-like site-specific DNA recombinase
MMANVLATFAQFERRLIGQRTRDALAIRKSQGVTLGRPRVIDDELRERVRLMRQGDLSLARIAAELTAEGIPTAHGGVWRASTIAGMVKP